MTSLAFNRFHIFSGNSIVDLGQLNDMHYHFSVKPDLIEYSVNFLFMKHTAQKSSFPLRICLVNVTKSNFFVKLIGPLCSTIFEDPERLISVSKYMLKVNNESK